MDRFEKEFENQVLGFSIVKDLNTFKNLTFFFVVEAPGFSSRIGIASFNSTAIAPLVYP
jgi:hypothetical protein